MTTETGSSQHARAFIIRLAAGDDGEWRGQASEPGSPDEWHVTFASLEEFWAGLQRRLADQPPPLRPLAPRDYSAEADPSSRMSNAWAYLANANPPLFWKGDRLR